MKRGFTLIELSIVIIILGLIVSAIFAGQNLINQANIRNFISQIRNYNTALATFKLKYDGIPGDLKNASFYGLQCPTGNICNSSNINVSPVVDETTGWLSDLGNGDGDERLETSYNAGYNNRDTEYTTFVYFSGERANFWVHLSNSQLIKESLSQLAGCEGEYTNCPSVPGENIPSAKIGSAIIAANSGGLWDAVGKMHFIGGTAGNYQGQNYAQTSSASGSAASGSMKIPDAYDIDAKLDDGTPDKGIIFSINYVGQGIQKGAANGEKGCGKGNPNCGNPCYVDNILQYNVKKDKEGCTIAIQADN